MFGFNMCFGVTFMCKGLVAGNTEVTKVSLYNQLPKYLLWRNSDFNKYFIFLIAKTMDENKCFHKTVLCIRLIFSRHFQMNFTNVPISIWHWWKTLSTNSTCISSIINFCIQWPRTHWNKQCKFVKSLLRKHLNQNRHLQFQSFLLVSKTGFYLLTRHLQKESEL